MVGHCLEPMTLRIRRHSQHFGAIPFANVYRFCNPLLRTSATKSKPVAYVPSTAPGAVRWFDTS
jgi:hypothetical protein